MVISLTGLPASMLSLYGMGMGTESSVDEETMKALSAAAASTSAHSAFPFQMYNPMLAYSSMLAAQGLGMPGMSAAAATPGYAQVLASAGECDRCAR